MLMGDNTAIWTDNRWYENQGDDALTNFPFYTYDSRTWGIRGMDLAEAMIIQTI